MTQQSAMLTTLTTRVRLYVRTAGFGSVVISLALIGYIGWLLWQRGSVQLAGIYAGLIAVGLLLGGLILPVIKTSPALAISINRWLFAPLAVLALWLVFGPMTPLGPLPVELGVAGLILIGLAWSVGFLVKSDPRVSPDDHG